MPGLRQLLAAHAPLLILDAASARIQVGALRADGSSEWQASDEEAGVGLFACLEKLSLRPEGAAAFVFCEGPGSVLGIRTAAMAIRAWCVLQPRPVFAYSSLALVAHALADPSAAVIADARRESWHHFQLGRGLRRIPMSELTGDVIMPEHFRNWSLLPPNVRRTPYSVDELLTAAPDADLFRETPSPDAFLHEEPSYVTWTPRIHQAPGR